MRQEWGEKEEESDSSAGRKCETICCWLHAVPPLPTFTFFLFFLPICPAVYGAQSVSVRELCIRTGDSSDANTIQNKRARPFLFQLICSFIFSYSHCRPLVLLQLLHYPSTHLRLFLCLLLNMQTWHTQMQQTHTRCTQPLWVGLSNGFWRFQFPLCHQRQKTLWAQLPLSHTHQTRPSKHTHIHTRKHGLEPIFGCNHKTHTQILAHLKPVWHVENHTIRVTQSDWEEH